jgi:hypothetical protein
MYASMCHITPATGRPYGGEPAGPLTILELKSARRKTITFFLRVWIRGAVPVSRRKRKYRGLMPLRRLLYGCTIEFRVGLNGTAAAIEVAAISTKDSRMLNGWEPGKSGKYWTTVVMFANLFIPLQFD